MIFSPFTEYFAQKSYDSAQEHGWQGANTPFVHGMFQGVNALAHIAPAIYMTSMANPHIMSYGYKGIDAARFGIRAATKDRRSFQRASSRAFQLGARYGGKVGGRVATRLIPGLGWALLAYDGYDLLANQRLFGVEL